MDPQILRGFLSGKGIHVPQDASDADTLNLIGAALDNRPSAPAPPPPAPGGYVEPLLGTHPDNVTPARAGAVFAQYAKQLCDSEGCDISEAWEKSKLLKPELYARLMSGAPADDALDNSFLARTDLKVPPAMKPFAAPALHLPTNVPDDVLNAAWSANRGQIAKVDSLMTFTGVMKYLMEKRGLSAAAARSEICDNYPDLYRSAGQSKASPPQ